MSVKSHKPDLSMEVAKDAANYSLAMSVSQVKGNFYDDGKEKQTYMQLTIRFPNPAFAKEMKERMRKRVHRSEQRLKTKESPATLDKRRKQEQALYDHDGKSLTSDGCEVSIVLPLSVTKVEADAKGFLVSFEPEKKEEAKKEESKKEESKKEEARKELEKARKEEAKRWDGYSGIWQATADYGLRIYYNWTHEDLEKVVVPPKKNAAKKKKEANKKDEPKK